MPDPGSAATREQVFAWMAEHGAGRVEAARAFGISAETVKTWMRRHGDPRKTREPANPLPAPEPSRARTPGPPPPRPNAPPAPPPARPAPKPPPAPSPPPPPNSAGALPADDRAELVAHVRLLRKRLVDIAKIVDRELERAIKDDRAPARFVDEMTRSAAATAVEMERVLKAHPGLMALVEEAAPPDADKAAENIARLLG